MIATIIILILLGMNFALALAKHGESRGEYNVLVTLINIGLSLALYYYAGLFNNFK